MIRMDMFIWQIWINNYVFLFSEFQNYLRSQAGNNTTINLIISTVDYLLRLQVSGIQGHWKMINNFYILLSFDNYAQAETFSYTFCRVF